MTVYFDNRGTPIIVGATVAYNISGEVALGRVEAISEAYRYSRMVPRISVRLLHKAAGHYEGHVSTVTKAVNMLVLPDGS